MSVKKHAEAAIYMYTYTKDNTSAVKIYPAVIAILLESESSIF